MIKFALFIFVSIFCTSAFSKNIEYKSKDNIYEGYILKSKKSAPTVLLIHDWDGLTDYEVKRAKMLHKLGYSVFAVDLFGKGIRPTEVTDKKQHTGELYKDRTKMRRLMKDALQTAQKNGLNTGNIVAMGYCFGGAAVLELARSGANMKAFYTFHGGLSTPEGQDYKKTKGHIVVYHGTSDSMISMQDFANLAESLDSASLTHEMISYGGAPHAFTVFDSSAFRKEADQQSWFHFTNSLEKVTK